MLFDISHNPAPANPVNPIDYYAKIINTNTNTPMVNPV
jgi:hypothetical protein